MDLRPWVGLGTSTQLSKLPLCAPSQAPDKVHSWAEIVRCAAWTWPLEVSNWSPYPPYFLKVYLPGISQNSQLFATHPMDLSPHETMPWTQQGHQAGAKGFHGELTERERSAEPVGSSILKVYKSRSDGVLFGLWDTILATGWSREGRKGTGLVNRAAGQHGSHGPINWEGTPTKNVASITAILTLVPGFIGPACPMGPWSCHLQTEDTPRDWLPKETYHTLAPHLALQCPGTNKPTQPCSLDPGLCMLATTSALPGSLGPV